MWLKYILNCMASKSTLERQFDNKIMAHKSCQLLEEIWWPTTVRNNM